MKSYPGDIEYGRLHVLRPMVAETLVSMAQVRDANFDPRTRLIWALESELMARGPVVGPVSIDAEDSEFDMIKIRARAMVKVPRDAGCMLQEICGAR